MDENEELKAEIASLHEKYDREIERLKQCSSNPKVKTDTTGAWIDGDYYVRAGLYYGLKGEKEEEIERLQDLVKMYEKDATNAIMGRMEANDQKWKLEQEIKRLQRRENALMGSIHSLNDMISEKERYIKGMEVELETLRDKLERIDCICTEGDE